MLATDQTVRLRPVAGIDAKTVRVRPADLPSKPAALKSARPAKPAKPLPPVISGMDARLCGIASSTWRSSRCRA